MYDHIKQPAAWYSWVLTNIDDFKDVSISIYQKFMNQADINYAKIFVAQQVKFVELKKKHYQGYRQHNF